MEDVLRISDRDHDAWNRAKYAIAAIRSAPAVQAEQEPVSQPYTLPADYLQGHKDGCEWAARMAEANHPQTGDWLFDDPIELAKAIRKGPDMLPVEPGNSPAIPEGYALVPSKLTAENGAKGALSGEFSETKFISCPECFGDDECETCDGSGRIEITVPVSWTSIKEIWAKGVEHFAAAPKQEAE
nr:molecular chaperone DnaJ [Atlantibacter hermannii]